jgi:hypothetical protein
MCTEKPARARLPAVGVAHGSRGHHGLRVLQGREGDSGTEVRGPFVCLFCFAQENEIVWGKKGAR